MREVRIVFESRPYQKPLINHFRAGGKRACAIWHRKAGKDRTATFIESELGFERVGLYWHALPRYEDARKVIWDAIMPTGQRLVDWAFPKEAGCAHLNHEMKVVLPNGSIWQPVGADNYNSLVGAFPVHVTWSEFALMSPLARQFIRQALAINDGSELVITTPRGYNHAHDLYQDAKAHPGRWYSSLLTVDDTHILPADVLEEERRTMPDELFRQEYYCDFSAANVGAILGRYMEAAEREDRVRDDVEYDPEGAPVEISSDIGFRDTAAWWFWQPRADGYALIDYDEDTGLDAGDWIERLRGKYPYGAIWLPHDAKAKTFATKRSALEQFLEARIAKAVHITPSLSKSDRINAARVVIRSCHFNRSRCATGLAGLREWSFEFNEETKVFSKEPRHDWASHPGDAFSYGALVMQQRKIPAPKAKPEIKGPRTIGEFIKASERADPRRARI